MISGPTLQAFWTNHTPKSSKQHRPSHSSNSKRSVVLCLGISSGVHSRAWPRAGSAQSRRGANKGRVESVAADKRRKTMANELTYYYQGPKADQATVVPESQPAWLGKHGGNTRPQRPKSTAHRQNMLKLPLREVDGASAEAPQGMQELSLMHREHFRQAVLDSVPTPAKVQQSLVCIYSAVICDMLGQALTIAVMPFYVESFGGTASSVGLVISVWATGNIFASMWMGRASDEYGRKTIMLVSLICSAIGFMLTALAWDLTSLIFARAFLGATSGSLPVAQSYISDIVRPKERPKRLGTLGALNGLAVVLGPPLGSFIAATPLGLSGPFYAGFVFSLAGLGMSSMYLLSSEDVELLRMASPAVRARDRWARIRDTHVPALAAAGARRNQDGERWTTICTACLARTHGSA